MDDQVTYAPGTSYDDVLSDMNKRLSILESDVKILPAIVSEILTETFQNFSFEVPGAYAIPVDAAICTLRDQYGSEAKPIASVDMTSVFSSLSEKLSSEVGARVNFDEVNRLRERVRELEEDLGYRKRVAKRLMDDPKGNRR